MAILTQSGTIKKPTPSVSIFLETRWGPQKPDLPFSRVYHVKHRTIPCSDDTIPAQGKIDRYHKRYYHPKFLSLSLSPFPSNRSIARDLIFQKLGRASLILSLFHSTFTGNLHSLRYYQWAGVNFSRSWRKAFRPPPLPLHPVIAVRRLIFSCTKREEFFFPVFYWFFKYL